MLKDVRFKTDLIVKEQGLIILNEERTVQVLNRICKICSHVSNKNQIFNMIYKNIRSKRDIFDMSIKKFCFFGNGILKVFLKSRI